MAGADASGRTVYAETTDASPMTEATLKDFCMDGGTLNTKAYNAISSDLETGTPKYWTKITYKWG